MSQRTSDFLIEMILQSSHTSFTSVFSRHRSVILQWGRQKQALCCQFLGHGCIITENFLSSYSAHLSHPQEFSRNEFQKRSKSTLNLCKYKVYSFFFWGVELSWEELKSDEMYCVTEVSESSSPWLIFPDVTPLKHVMFNTKFTYLKLFDIAWDLAEWYRNHDTSTAL